MGCKFLGFLLLLACSSLAATQVLPKANLFAGYSFQNADVNSNGSNRAHLNGWEASLEGKLLPFIGLVLDFSGHYGSADVTNPSLCSVCQSPQPVHDSEHNFLLGPRVSVGLGHFRPFVHGLFGGAHVKIDGTGFSTTDTSFATALGGNLDYRIAGPLEWRFQGDYLQTRFFSSKQNNYRLSTGIVLAF